jgi:hypothetical protein
MTARAPTISRRRRYRSPGLEIPLGRRLSPLEFCRGTSPSQAASWRPELKHDGSVTVAAGAVAVIGPTPGIVAGRLLHPYLH